MINRNKATASRLNLKHFKNIRCNDIKSKSCIIPIYKTPEDAENIKQANDNEYKLIVYTLNKKYIIFLDDLLYKNYGELINRMRTRYKLDV